MAYKINENYPVCPEGCCIAGHDPEMWPVNHKSIHVRPMFEVTDDSGGEAGWFDGGRIGDLSPWRDNW